MSVLLRHRLTLAAYAIAVVFILVATLRPSTSGPVQGWTLCIYCPDGQTSEAAQNVLLFVPLGMAAGLGTLYFGVATFLGFAFSLVVECAQMFIPGRDPNLGDIVFNTTGTAVGWLLGAWSLAMVMAQGRRAAAQAALAAAATLATLAAFAWVLQPALADPPYRVHRITDHDMILAARLGDVPLDAGELPGSAALALTARATLSVRAVIGPADLRPYWLRVRDARHRDVLSVRQLGADVLIRYRSRAAALSLESPELRARNALAGYRPGDTVDVQVVRDGLRHCAVVEGTATCGFGPSLGHSWVVVESPGGVPAWLNVVLDTAWMGLLFVPVGLTLRRDRLALVAAAAAFAGLWIVPRAFGLEAPRLLHVLGAAAAVAGAAWVATLLRGEPGAGHHSRRHHRGFGARASAGARR